MFVQISLVKLELGPRAVLRGTPDLVGPAINRAKQRTGINADIIGVADTVSSQEQEDVLWRKFIEIAARSSQRDEILARDAWRRWQHKASFLWTFAGEDAGVAYFMSGDDGMILR